MPRHKLDTNAAIYHHGNPDLAKLDRKLEQRQEKTAEPHTPEHIAKKYFKKMEKKLAWEPGPWTRTSPCNHPRRRFEERRPPERR
jgi:hypothetical protein